LSSSRTTDGASKAYLGSIYLKNLLLNIEIKAHKSLQRADEAHKSLDMQGCKDKLSKQANLGGLRHHLQLWFLNCFLNYIFFNFLLK
jgi:hypothetical protein